MYVITGVFLFNQEVLISDNKIITANKSYRSTSLHLSLTFTLKVGQVWSLNCVTHNWLSHSIRCLPQAWRPFSNCMCFSACCKHKCSPALLCEVKKLLHNLTWRDRTNSICAYLIWLITIFSMQIMILSMVYIYIYTYVHT